MKNLSYCKNYKLKNDWLRELNLFLNHERSSEDIWKLANHIYDDISLGYPKVDNIFFASIEYFIVDKLPDKKTLIENIKQMVQLLSISKPKIN